MEATKASPDLVSHINPKVSVVIPIYKGAPLVKQSISSLERWAAPWSRGSLEILLYVQKSPDNTLSLIENMIGANPVFQIIGSSQLRGKGYGVKQGVLRSRGDFIFFMDFDLSASLLEIDRFCAYLQSHSSIDVLIGERKWATARKTQPFHRRILGSIFPVLSRAILGAGFPDPLCGFKAFRKNAAITLFSAQAIEGFAFDVELLARAKSMNLKIKSVPVEWKFSPHSVVRPLWDGCSMLIDLIRIYLTLNGVWRFF